MAVLRQNSFDYGTAGTEFTTAGSEAGGDAFNFETGINYFRTDQPFDTGLSVEIAQNGYLQWSALGGVAIVSGRLYFKYATVPTTSARLIQFRTSGSLTYASIYIGATGDIEFFSASKRGETAGTVDLTTWSRAEWRIDATNGNWEIAIFDDQHSTTPTGSLSGTDTTIIGNTLDHVRIGSTNNVGAPIIDEPLLADDYALPGPVNTGPAEPADTTPPAVAINVIHGTGHADSVYDSAGYTAATNTLRITGTATDAGEGLDSMTLPFTLS